MNQIKSKQMKSIDKSFFLSVHLTNTSLLIQIAINTIYNCKYSPSIKCLINFEITFLLLQLFVQLMAMQVLQDCLHMALATFVPQTRRTGAFNA